MSPVVPDRRDNSDLGLWGVTWSGDQPGMSPVAPDRRVNSDLGTTWSVDQPRMSLVVPDRRDNSVLGLWGITWSVDQPRDVSGCPGQKGPLGPGSLGDNLVSGPNPGCLRLSRTEGTTRTWDFGGQLGQWTNPGCLQLSWTTWTVVGRFIHGRF